MMQPSPRFETSRTLWIQILLVLACSLPLLACTNVLVTPSASLDGSTFITYSCDGGIFAAVRIAEAATFASGATALLVDDAWFMSDSEVPRALGRIPQPLSTYRYLDLMAGPSYAHIGGMNEHGVCIAETTIVDARPELSNPYGWMAPFSVSPERSLMTQALRQATTAREAVLLIGSLAESYGYRSPFPVEGEQFAIGDGDEVWSMEIFGPGSNWRQGSEEPGALWCAQRVPDGEIAVSANRSRIGEIDLENAEMFLASANVYALAEEMGWWDPTSGTAFHWNQVYAPSDRFTSIVREWRALDLVAPSLGLEPIASALPFSVHPDSPQSVLDVMAVQRDLLEGTAYDMTANSRFLIRGETSPLACPSCTYLYNELMGIKPARTIANPRSSATCLYQTNAAAPEALRGCTWFGFGNAATTCYVPIYSGVTALPADWSSTDLEDFDTSTPFWALTLPGKLATIEWQSAFPVIQSLRDPAEETFISEQETLQALVGTLGADEGNIEALLAEYTTQRLEAVRMAYVDLHDYLVAQFFSGIPGVLTVTEPVIGIPAIEGD